MANLDLIAIRRHLHRHPELSGCEYETARFVEEQLAKLGVTNVVRVAETGVLATLDTGKAGASVLLRADLDALPIREANTFDYASRTDGSSHKCGHDGHTAMLLGACEKLVQNMPPSGVVYALFQPAEENGTGAERVLHDARFNISPDWVFALHNLPGFNLGDVVVRDGLFSASVISLIVKLKGRSAHAASPDEGRSPVPFTVEFYEACTHQLKQAQAKGFAGLTWVMVNLGEPAYGVAAHTGEVHLTLRAETPDLLNNFLLDVQQQARDLAASHGLKLELNTIEPFEAINNAPEAVALIRNSAQKLKLNAIVQHEPFRWGEDFGRLIRQARGAMFGLGSGKQVPPLHHPEYNFPDELLPLGVQMFEQLTRQALSNNHA